MWGYVSETSVISRNTDKGCVAMINTCEANNVKIITWINNSIEHFIDT